jgi:hypothetical protein
MKILIINMARVSLLLVGWGVTAFTFMMSLMLVVPYFLESGLYSSADKLLTLGYVLVFFFLVMVLWAAYRKTKGFEHLLIKRSAGANAD